MPDDEFDGETPDQKRAAEKRKAAAEAAGGGDATERAAAPVEAEPAPKTRRVKD